MKRSLILLAALGLFGATPVLAAKGETWVGLQFGRSVPTGDFTKSAKPGFEGGLVVTHMQSEHTGIGVDVAYHAWPGSDDANAVFVAIFGPGSEVNLHAIQATGHVLYECQTGGMARPYAKGGAGVYWVTTKLHTPFGNVDDTQPNFVYNVGAGVNFKASPTRYVGIGGMYHKILASGFDTNLFTVGVNLLWGVGVK